MATKKQPEIVARRVWRMTADSPMGEYLELVPKETQGEAPTGAPKRTYHPETPPLYKAVSVPPLTLEEKPSVPPTPISRQATAPKPGSLLRRRHPEPIRRQFRK